jgi:sec-independent protein translocase protein TatA
MFANFGPGHWAVLAVVVILLFGAKKLPDAARSLGKSMRIFKSEIHELQNEGKSETPAPPATPVQSERVETPVPPASPPPSGQSHTDARPA